MKRLYLLIVISFIAVSALGEHISGGEMSYVYLGPGTLPGTLKYQLTLKMFRDCSSSGAALDPNIAFAVFRNADFSTERNIVDIAGGPVQRIQKTPLDPCVADAIELLVCFDTRTYTTIIDNLPITAQGYTVAYQRCCRVNGMFNITSLEVGSTYFAVIPGNQLPGNETNSSPVFGTRDTVLVCSGRSIVFNFSATDPNPQDSLSYGFYNAFSGGGITVGSCFTCIIPNPAAPPPYIPVNYINGFSANQPLGPNVSINPVTGIISGEIPNLGAGANEIFAITVLVKEWRNGIKIGEHFKDLQIRVVDCNVPTAILNPLPVTCDGFTITFSNDATNNPPPTFHWEFGDPATGSNNVSSLESPTHTFSDTGIFTIKLVLNRGLSCGDSTTMQVAVYPGFFPGFAPTAPFCVGRPVSFNDTTRTRYGIVSNWAWNFGDPSTLSDTSHLQNPSYTFNQAGSYTVKLVSGNSKGCKDSSTRVINVIPPPTLSVFPRDTTYCGRDSIRLTATGNGTFAWSPNTFIAAASSATPLVFPTAPSKYFVTLTNLGCQSRDSVNVVPDFNLTNAVVANPATICEGDTVTLTGSSNRTNVSWQWTPANLVAAPTSPSTLAYPLANSNITLLTRWGKNCIASATSVINVTPLASPNAGNDTSFCVGQAGITLAASGGNSYQWTPASGLSNPGISNPVATPTVTTSYVVSVGVSGCSRRRTDSVLVTVRQKPTLTMPRDTLICAIDTLQLTAGGTGNFQWTPSTYISATAIANPMVSPDVPTTYYVKLTDAFNCFRIDSVFIDVKPDVTVNAGADTTICASDGFFLHTTSDGLNHSWSPSIGLDNPNIKNPFAAPSSTTRYTVTANLGKCQRSDDVTITVVPLPQANAGQDIAVCIGSSAQLSATGGSTYVWTPATYLDDPNIANPRVIQPQQNIQYVVTVSDVRGCTKEVKDSVRIRVIQQIPVNAGPPDTSVVEGQSLSLLATGGSSYLWSPATWLNNNNVPNPVSTPQGNIVYTVTGRDAAGCVGTDTIRVSVYALDPDLYVPTAFTPNGDGINDVIRPILLGMKKLNYFRIYNRYGELVFETRETGKGWNGFYKGQAQNTASFVWVAEGITFKDETRQKKGNVLLIR